jgi:hypothetical protein
VEESRAVLERLERIEELERAGAGPREIIAELRALVAEAVAWSRVEGGDAGERAADELQRALEAAPDAGPPAGAPIAHGS